jgi:hypothetical protein
MNTFRVFGAKATNNDDNSVSSINSTNSSNTNSNLNLHIEEKPPSVLDNIAPLSEFNATNLTRERTDTINEQLSNDPKLMDKMFFELTKTLGESDEEKEVKEESTEEEEEEFGVAFVDELDETIGKKKETISDPMQNISEDTDVKQNDIEGALEDVSKDNQIKQSIEPFLKKKRGKKK